MSTYLKKAFRKDIFENLFGNLPAQILTSYCQHLLHSFYQALPFSDMLTDFQWFGHNDKRESK